MKRFFLILALALPLALAGCGITGNIKANNAGQAVLDAYARYTQLAEGAAAYGTLSFCDKAPQPCSDRATVAKIDVVRKLTEPGIEQAHQAVLDPRFNSGVDGDRWKVVAEAALNALKEVAGNLPPPPPKPNP